MEYPNGFLICPSCPKQVLHPTMKGVVKIGLCRPFKLSSPKLDTDQCERKMEPQNVPHGAEEKKLLSQNSPIRTKHASLRAAKGKVCSDPPARTQPSETLRTRPTGSLPNSQASLRNQISGLKSQPQIQTLSLQQRPRI